MNLSISQLELLRGTEEMQQKIAVIIATLKAKGYVIDDFDLEYNNGVLKVGVTLEVSLEDEQLSSA